jgi:hypothetical protein
MGPGRKGMLLLLLGLSRIVLAGGILARVL